MENVILKIENLTFRYSPNSDILNFRDLEITQQQPTLILGDSGTGKSTLLHLIGGFSKPTTGKIFINNNDMYSMSDTERDTFRAKNIGFIFQEAHLLKNLTLSENIRLAQSLAGFSVDQKKIDVLLQKLQLDSHSLKYPTQLSRGQLQRAAIARAIINQPLILIADEPTASLDDKNTTIVLNLLEELAREYQSTLIIATHDKRIKDRFSNTYLL